MIRVFRVQLFLALFNTLSGLVVDDPVEQNCSASLLDVHHKRNDTDGVECPPWYILDKTGHCETGPGLGGIIEQDLSTLQTSIMECNCMTEENGTLSVGACMFTCAAFIHGVYPLPCHVSELQNFTCADFNRHGRLCGECMEGYAVPAYSYDLHCVKCDDYQYNWLKYLAVAFLPLTLFYIVVALLSISFTSPTFSGVAMVFQIGANPMQLKIILRLMEARYIVAPVPLRAILSFASLWNLDFFRLYYSFCLHPNASAMKIMALEYALAMYPVFLIAVTYVLVKRHDNNFKPLVWLWRHLGSVLQPLKKQWNVKTSLVDVFASFIFLSSTRLLWISMNFLLPMTVYTYESTSHGHMELTTKYHLFTSPSVDYFGKEHLPFAFLAMTVLFMLYILPMLLLFVYPFHWFQHILNKTGMNSLVLHTFIEVFQGSYKDGTNGTKDYRYFSGFLLLLPLTLFLTFHQTLSSFYYPVASIWILLYLILIAVFQPFKCQSHNNISIGMATALLWTTWGMIINVSVLSMPLRDSKLLEFWMVSIVLIAVSLSIPMLYLLYLTCTCFKRLVISRP